MKVNNKLPTKTKVTTYVCGVESFDSITVKPLKINIMNTLRNKVQLIGNLGNDPEIITLESGKKLAKFSLATNENYKDKDGQKQTKTDWHNVVAWNKTVDIIEQYVSKGKEIAIEGKLSTRSYEDKEGQKRYTTEVIINELLLL